MPRNVTRLDALRLMAGAAGVPLAVNLAGRREHAGGER